MTRRADWRSRLRSYVDDCRRRPIDLGRHDCALFAAGAVEAMTGIDHAADFRGSYGTMAGGLRRVRKAGYIDHVDMVAALYPEIRPAILAQVGDIAVVDGEGAPALGIVGGARVFVLRPAGMVTLDLTAIQRAFRV